MSSVDKKSKVHPEMAESSLVMYLNRVLRQNPYFKDLHFVTLSSGGLNSRYGIYFSVLEALKSNIKVTANLVLGYGPFPGL